MSGAKLCPNCGNLLRVDTPDPVPVGRLVLAVLLFWAAVALILAFLWSASSTGERIGALGAIALLVWFARRARRRGREPVGDQAYFYCDQCQQRFEADRERELRPQ
jgi:hypothetical protein